MEAIGPVMFAPPLYSTSKKAVDSRHCARHVPCLGLILSDVCTQIVNTVGLALGIVAAVMAYKWGESVDSLRLEENTPDSKGRKAGPESRRRAWWLKVGVGAAVVGLLFRIWMTWAC
jgi:hypothetical protein